MSTDLQDCTQIFVTEWRCARGMEGCEHEALEKLTQSERARHSSKHWARDADAPHPLALSLPGIRTTRSHTCPVVGKVQIDARQGANLQDYVWADAWRRRQDMQSATRT